MAGRSEQDVKLEAKKRLMVAQDPMEKIRLQCLTRGTNGIKGLGKMFQIFDDNGTRKLEFSEFEKGLQNYGLHLSEGEAKAIYKTMDKDNSGNIEFGEFLIALRPPMSATRQKITMEAFKKLDKNGDGLVDINDMKHVYNVTKNPKFMSGEATEEQLFKEFLRHFEIGDHVDGVVTKEEFLNYYAGISASIDSDIYFDLMMRNAWKM